MARALTQDEELTLRAFRRQVNRLRESSIVKQGKLKLSYTTKLDFKSGDVTTTFQGYDDELFQAQLPILRQFVLNDSVSFNHVHNVINQCCDRPELLGWIRYARKKWDEKLESLPEEVHRHLQNVSALSVDDALQKVFYGYGGLFHVDINEPEEDKSVKAIQDGMLHHAFPFLCWCLNVFDSVIYWWLDAQQDTVPLVPTS